MLLCLRVLFSWITCVSASARQFAYGEGGRVHGAAKCLAVLAGVA